MLSMLLREAQASAGREPSQSPTPSDPFKESWTEIMESLDQSDCEESGPTDTIRRDMRSSLDCLPEELLLKVIEYVDNIDGHDGIRDFRALHSLTLTCRRLYRVAIPILYRQYISDEDEYPFVRTLVECPELAKHVKQLHWDYVRRRPDWRLDGNEVATKLEFWGHYFAIEAALAMQGEWYRRQGETPDAYCTAALMHTPNVEHLSLKDNGSLYAGHDDRVSRRWLEPIKLGFPHPFQSLKSADITMLSMRLDDIAALMSVPSLRVLHITRLGEEGRVVWTLPPSVSKLEDLRLQNCSLNWHNVVDVISSCISLHRFCYIHQDQLLGESPQLERLMINLEGVKDALNAHAATLLFVELYVARPYPQLWNSYGNMGSFSAYTRLEELHVPICTMLPRDDGYLGDRLPGSLQTLRLTECDYEPLEPGGLEILKGLTKYAGNSRVSLRRVYVSDDVTGYMRSAEWKNLQAHFAFQGLELRIWEWKDRDNDDWEDLT